MGENQVLLSGRQTRKCYRSALACRREAELLTALTPTGLVPPLLCREERALTLATVSGLTLLETLEPLWQGPPGPRRRLLRLLVDWAAQFQAGCLHVLGQSVALEDPNFRNFILTPHGNLVGLDLEHWHYGSSVETPALLLAYLDGYRGASAEDILWLRGELIRTLSLAASDLREAEARGRALLRLRRTTAPLRRGSLAVLCPDGASSPEPALYALAPFDQVLLVSERSCLPHETVPPAAPGPLGALLAARLRYPKARLLFLAGPAAALLTEAQLYGLYAALAPEDNCLLPTLGGLPVPGLGLYRANGPWDGPARHIPLEPLPPPSASPQGKRSPTLCCQMCRGWGIIPHKRRPNKVPSGSHPAISSPDKLFCNDHVSLYSLSSHSHKQWG